ncbi:MAG: hypothetical protein QGG40_11325, partial [Myxococcota bacterium]|nr:hypothetical protein [Myxococcota bacterium]
VDRLTRRLLRGPLAEIHDELGRILGKQPDLPRLLVAEQRVRALLARGLPGQGQAKAAPDGDEKGSRVSDGKKGKTRGQGRSSKGGRAPGRGASQVSAKA